MKIRSSHISASISNALSHSHHDNDDSPSPGCLGSCSVFFSIFHLYLARYRPADFLQLRRDIWELDEEKYLQSFQQGREADRENPDSNNHGAPGRGKQSSATAPEETGELVPIGDLGYSGSTFFTTPNSRYLVKSLPRRFEHDFFTHDLFGPYTQHMKAHPESLLIRITDMVYTPLPTLGGIVGTAPTHHVVMENLLYGKKQHEEEAALEDGTDNATGSGAKIRWETYDLKPESYFFPERDIADGKLAPDSVKDKLIDTFPDKVRVAAPDRDLLMEILSRDTQLLADNKAVDYSLFLVRFPTPSASASDESNPFSDHHQPARPPNVSTRADRDPWRNGVPSTDGAWVYRAAVLDFFWAKHKFQPMAMTGLVKTFNLVARKGPMSITAEPGEYRERFLKMARELCVAGS